MNKPKCKHCQHDASQHAPDIQHPTTEPCWHGAGTGNGCDCRNYEPKS